MTFRGSVWAFLLGFALLVAALISFGLDAPTAVGALFLVAMVACGLAGFVLAARTSGRIRSTNRAARQQAAQPPAQRSEPWQD